MFTRRDPYGGKPASAPDDQMGEITGMTFRHNSIPQIDSPITPAANQWNHIVADKLADKAASAGCDGEEDYTLGYRIGMATSKLVSVSWESSDYFYGAAHPQWDGWNENYVFGKQVRPLAATDLFDRSKPWANKLGQLLEAAVRKQEKDATPVSFG